MTYSIPRLATIGEVANLLQVQPHRIEYVLRSRPHIKPRATASSALLDDDAIAQIRHELNSIDARRVGVTR